MDSNRQVPQHIWAIATGEWFSQPMAILEVQRKYSRAPKYSREMPGEPGNYWFRGTDLQANLLSGIGVAAAYPSPDSDEHVFLFGSVLYRKGELSGQFWGPLEPPWEGMEHIVRLEPGE